MRYFLYIPVFLAIISCRMIGFPQSSPNTISFFDYEIVFPLNVEIEETLSESANFAKGLRYALYSMDAEEYKIAIQNNTIHSYFALGVYKPQTNVSSVQNWLENKCGNKNIVMKNALKNDTQNYELYQIEKMCTSLVNYIVLRNGTLYRFETTDDTVDYETIWNTLSDLRF